MAKKPSKVNRSWVKEYKPFERAMDNSDIYNSWPWRKLSKRIRESNPLCKHCEQLGIITKGVVADHIIPIARGGEVFNEDNIQVLCERCHNIKSSKESRG